jgi:uncharacterized protein (DUF2249 family)
MAVNTTSIRSSVRQAGHAVASQAPGLADEHAQLLQQVAVRAEDLIAAASEGRWPSRELEALLGYLRVEILRQVTDEEMLLFPARGATTGLDRLGRDHVRLRAGVEALERAAGDGKRSPAMLVTAVRDFLRQLEDHLVAEEAVLAGPGRPDGTPATTALGARPHEWYPLTEGPVIDLEALPPEQAVAATTERLLRLRRGEDVELRSDNDPFAVWQQIDELAPLRYGFVYLEDGPDHWRVQVTRRAQA